MLPEHDISIHSESKSSNVVIRKKVEGDDNDNDTDDFDEEEVGEKTTSKSSRSSKYLY